MLCVRSVVKPPLLACMHVCAKAKCSNAVDVVSYSTDVDAELEVCLFSVEHVNYKVENR